MAFKSKVKVSVIIPNWNGKQLLQVCLPSLKKQSFKDFEVIIIDNGSTDGSVSYIKNKFPEFLVFELNANTGFSPAVNLGLKLCKGENILFLNNDTKVDSRCLEYLYGAIKSRPEVGMVAAKMLQMNSPKKIDSAGDYIDAVGHANNIGLDEYDGDKFNKGGYVFLVTGGGGIFKREVFEKVGFFDEKYFAYFEDIDLCLRAQMMGFKGWYEPKAIIYHIHKATSKRNPAFLEYLQFRNMTQTIIKDFPTKLLKKDYNWLKIILVNLNTVRYLIFKGFGISAIKAEIFILLNLPRLLKKRSKIQKNKKVSDSYIIENIQPRKIKIGFFSF